MNINSESIMYTVHVRVFAQGRNQGRRSQERRGRGPGSREFRREVSETRGQDATSRYKIIKNEAHPP